MTILAEIHFEQIFLTKIFIGTNFYSTNIFLGPTFFLIIFLLQFFSHQIFFAPKLILDKNFLWFEIFRANFLDQHIQDQIIAPKIFVGQNFCLNKDVFWNKTFFNKNFLQTIFGSKFVLDLIFLITILNKLFSEEDYL